MIQKEKIESYSVIGYDKDNDVFICYFKTDSKDEAITKAKEYSKLVANDELRREDNGEPIDWIEVYWNWNCDDERIVWGSYK